MRVQHKTPHPHSNNLKNYFSLKNNTEKSTVIRPLVINLNSDSPRKREPIYSLRPTLKERKKDLRPTLKKERKKERNHPYLFTNQ